MREHRITLASGRVLACAEFGVPAGVPVFYCHGFPGSRLEAAFAEPMAKATGVRLIAADRPGMGRSDYCPDRAISGWAADACALADHLGVERFSVLGISGGAPYALACALRLPRRVRSTVLVACVGPPTAAGRAATLSASTLGLRLVAMAPWLAAVFASVLRALVLHASPVLFALLGAGSSSRGRHALRDDNMRSVLAASMREAFRAGSRGAATDLKLLSRPWGFALRDLQTPVHIWHGEKDRLAPVCMARFMEERLANCTATYLPEHGHYSLVHDYAEQILSSAVQRSLALDGRE